MSRWMRFEKDGKLGFGKLEGDTVAVHTGDMFVDPKPAGVNLKLSEVRLRTPCDPTKMIALWNNFRELAAKNKFTPPQEPLWLLKAPNSYWPGNQPIRRPARYGGKIVYEGELGIVIGRRCSNVSEEDAGNCIFGYTCVNDVTAADLLKKDPGFDQWTRAKSFDTFGVFGPVIATGVQPMLLTVKTFLNGAERQSYPVSDMFFPPRRLVSLLSRDVTLMPGDVIACGTSVGVGVMREASNLIEVAIEGIGRLSNIFEQEVPVAA